MREKSLFDFVLCIRRALARGTASEARNCKWHRGQCLDLLLGVRVSQTEGRTSIETARTQEV